MSEFFSGIDIAHGHKYDLPSHTDVRIAGMIAENHGTLALARLRGSNEQVVGNLDLGRPERRLQTIKHCSIKNVSALDGHDLAPGNLFPRKQASAVNAAGANFSLGRKKGGAWLRVHFRFVPGCFEFIPKRSEGSLQSSMLSAAIGPPHW